MYLYICTNTFTIRLWFHMRNVNSIYLKRFIYQCIDVQYVGVNNEIELSSCVFVLVFQLLFSCTMWTDTNKPEFQPCHQDKFQGIVVNCVNHVSIRTNVEKKHNKIRFSFGPWKIRKLHSNETLKPRDSCVYQKNQICTVFFFSFSVFWILNFVKILFYCILRQATSDLSYSIISEMWFDFSTRISMVSRFLYHKFIATHFDDLCCWKTVSFSRFVVIFILGLHKPWRYLFS